MIEVKAVKTKEEAERLYKKIKETKINEKVFYLNPDVSLENCTQFLLGNFAISYMAFVDNKLAAFAWFDKKENNLMRCHYGFIGDQNIPQTIKGATVRSLADKVLSDIPELTGVWNFIPDYFEKTIGFMKKYFPEVEVVGKFPGGFVMPDGKEYGAVLFYYRRQ